VLDPYWAVLTDPKRKHGGWDPDSFFATGEAEVGSTLDIARGLGLPAAHQRALDFGCGLGRLTRALAGRFEKVLGLDISAELVAHARCLNADVPSCEFRAVEGGALSELEGASVDLVYSSIVLQHQPSHALIRTHVAEFMRLVRPGGLVVFQLPTAIPLRHRLQPRRRLYAGLRQVGLSPTFLYRRLRLDPMRMTAMSSERVAASVATAGGRVACTVPDPFAASFPSATYFVTR
jgi:SAM-dependent methyltransferase